MDDNLNVHKSNATNVRHSNSSVGAGHQKIKNKKTKPLIILASIILVALTSLAVGWLLYKSNTNSYIDNKKYQAVFLINGDVYFGKLDKINSGYYKLNDIFYPRLNETDDKDVQKASSGASDMQLIKLGSEVHGPEDEMIIDKSQVLFFENLKPDGTVASSIKKYYDSGK